MRRDGYLRYLQILAYLTVCGFLFFGCSSGTEQLTQNQEQSSDDDDDDHKHNEGNGGGGSDLLQGGEGGTDFGMGGSGGEGGTDSVPPSVQVFYVSVDGNDSMDGLSWETALSSLQNGIDKAAIACPEASQSRCEVWVLAGKYSIYQNDVTNTISLKPNVHIFGGFTKSEKNSNDRDLSNSANETILDGHDRSSLKQVYHVISGEDEDDEFGTLNDITPSNSTLDGFTITGGNASDAEFENSGGCLLLKMASPSLQNLNISQCEAASYGGGIELFYSSPTINHVNISYNQAEDGGGVNLYFSSPTLSNVIFLENSAASSGGGMDLNTSNPILTNVFFSSNDAIYGGGMDLWSSNPILTNVIFLDNMASNAGGGVDLYRSSAVFTNVTMARNIANFGGGIFVGASDSKPTITNSVFAYNTNYNLFNSSDDPGFPVIQTSDLFSLPDWNNHNLTLESSNLEVEPKYFAYSNIDLDGNGSTESIPTDFHLATDSPIINNGVSTCLVDLDGDGIESNELCGQDPDGSESDMGIYGGPSADDWDLDGDGLEDYFWTGGYCGNLPSGFILDHFDCNDQSSSECSDSCK